LQVRFHRNIAASSLAADCNVPQRPPAKLEVLHLSRWFTHTHTNAYTQKPLRTETFPVRRPCREQLLHREDQRSFYAEQRLHDAKSQSYINSWHSAFVSRKDCIWRCQTASLHVFKFSLRFLRKGCIMLHLTLLSRSLTSFFNVRSSFHAKGSHLRFKNAILQQLLDISLAYIRVWRCKNMCNRDFT